MASNGVIMRGFTLIELVAVITIVGVLSAFSGSMIVKLINHKILVHDFDKVNHEANLSLQFIQAKLQNAQSESIRLYDKNQCVLFENVFTSARHEIKPKFDDLQYRLESFCLFENELRYFIHSKNEVVDDIVINKANQKYSLLSKSIEYTDIPFAILKDNEIANTRLKVSLRFSENETHVDLNNTIYLRN